MKKSLGKKLVAIGFALASFGVQAVDLEIKTGLTDVKSRRDGNWHQKYYGSYNLDTVNPNFGLGLTGYTPWDWLRWSAGVEYDGEFSTRCDCLSSDRAYEEYKKGNNVGWPSSDFRTRGDSYGVYATLAPEWKSGNWTLFVKGGIGYYGISNDVTVYNWYPATDASMLKWGEPQTLKVKNGRHWQTTPIIGLGLKYKTTGIELSARESSTEGLVYPIAQDIIFRLHISSSFNLF